MFGKKEDKEQLQRAKRIEELTKEENERKENYTHFTLHLSNNSSLNFRLAKPVGKEIARFIEDTIMEMNEAKKSKSFLKYYPYKLNLIFTS